MNRSSTHTYRPYAGPIRTRTWLGWWPITRTELGTLVFRWRFLPLYLVVLTPLLFREALLYARFVVAEVQVNMKTGLTASRMGRLMQWDELVFYSDYLDDRFLWLFLLLTAAVLGVPMVARDLRTRAWEIYFSRAIGRLDYFLGKFAAVFLVLFAATAGGVLVLYLTTSLLGPDPEFFARNLAWLLPLIVQSVLLSAVLALAALAFGTLSENGIVLAGAWLGVFFIAYCVGRVLQQVEPSGGFDWIDPRYLFLASSSVLHGHAPTSGFPAWAGPPLLLAAAAVSVVVLVRFLRRQTEGIG
jgi:ABC-type transport system involved in multi-copper enzyme maturation permease subunit